jgi:glucose/arabinose dehydrogenase
LYRDGGKVFRINDDGSIPSDNPYVDKIGINPAIYSFGHRNPQGIFYHPESDEIWTNEHGPRGGDEINIIEREKNYGWPVISYGINYDSTIFTDLTKKEGMEQPLYYWVPSIAPSCFEYLDSDNYGDWKGSLLVGSLNYGYLERLTLNVFGKVNYREKIAPGVGRVRDVKVSPSGFIHIAVEKDGIYKIVPQ